jgi:hypothetical protein
MGPQLTPAEFGLEIERALARYDRDEAAEVSRRVRESAGQDAFVTEVVKIYEETIAEYAVAPPPDRELEARAAAAHLREISCSFSRQRAVMYDSVPFRVTERLRQIPLVGRLSRTFARALAGKRAG